MENILKLIFPQECLFCKAVGDTFCDTCLSEAVLLSNQRCIVCDKDSDKGETHSYCRSISTPSQCLSVFEYEGKVRDCIKFSKYGPKQFSALKKLVRECVGLAKEWGYSFSGYVCVPIPISNRKYNYRGFNQAAFVADYFSFSFGLLKNYKILQRAKDTKAQHDLSRQSRFKNLEDTFVCKPNEVRGKKFILVDDITTTGATFLSAAACLYKEGAQDVKCFALSKRV